MRIASASSLVSSPTQPGHSRVPRNGQRPQHRPSDENRAGPEREGRQHVGAPAQPAVHVDLRASASDRIDHLQKCPGRGHQPVQLPTAMIGDQQPGGARRRELAGVVAPQHSLDHNW